MCRSVKWTITTDKGSEYASESANRIHPWYSVEQDPTWSRGSDGGTIYCVCLVASRRTKRDLICIEKAPGIYSPLTTEIPCK